jgi:hypothetical protein
LINAICIPGWSKHFHTQLSLLTDIDIILGIKEMDIVVEVDIVVKVCIQRAELSIYIELEVNKIIQDQLWRQ